MSSTYFTFFSCIHRTSTNRCQSIRQPRRGWCVAHGYSRSRILSPRWWLLGHCRLGGLPR